MAKLFQAASNVQTVTAAPNATASAFGGGPSMVEAGKSLSDAASNVGTVIADRQAKYAEIEQRQRSRTDAVARAKATQEYNTFAARLAADAEVQGDLTSPEYQAERGNALQQKMMEILGAYEGSPDSQSRLAVALENLRGDTSRTMAARGNEIGIAFVNESIERGNDQAAEYAFNTGDIGGALDMVEDNVVEFGDGISEDNVSGSIRSGNAGVYTGVFNKAKDENNLDEMESLIAMPGVLEAVGGVAFRKMRTDTIAARTIENGWLKKVQDRVSTEEYLLGREMTPTEKANMSESSKLDGAAYDVKVKWMESRGIVVTKEMIQAIAGIGSPTQSTASWALEFQANTGKAPTVAQIEKHMGAFIPEGEVDLSAFPSTLTGSTLDIFSANQVAFGNSSLTELQDNQFIEAILNYTTPYTYKDDTSGRLVTIERALSPGVRQAMEDRGMTLESLRGNAGVDEGAEDQAGGLRDETGALTSDGVRESVVEPGQTGWDWAKLGVGFTASVQNTIAGVPGVGPAVKVPSNVTEAIAGMKLMVRDVARALSVNPKHPVAEMEDIMKSLNLDPKAFDTVESYNSRLIAADGMLEAKYKDAKKISEAKTGTTTELRRAALQKMAEVMLARETLGVPTLVTTVADINALPPGTPYRRVNADGQLVMGVSK
tara:strand:+ start:498 stop:2477 length:1980 start_codon:yes stop_codon:yes gene_type:complete